MSKHFLPNFIFFVTFFILFSVSAYAEEDIEYTLDADLPEQAKYISMSSSYAVGNLTPEDLFLDELSDRKITAGNKEIFLGDEENSSLMISLSALNSNLVEYGTFPDTDSTSSLFDFLTEVNGFEISEHKADAEYGDVVICANCPGIVTDDNTALFCDENYNAVSYLIDEINISQVIHVIYPRYEHLAYLYMTDELGYPVVKTCGILANLYYESMIDPCIEETANKIGFGICQWSKDRRLDLEHYCARNHRSLTSIYTQLDFMDYELQNDFHSLNSSLKRVTNDDEGAYEAAMLFCNVFEKPAYTEETSDSGVDRGIMAMDTYFPVYGGVSF